MPREPRLVVRLVRGLALGLALAAAGSGIAGVAAQSKPAPPVTRVWQGTLTLPTYQQGPPDPNPPFDLFVTGRFNYPYTLLTNLTGQSAPHAWRALYLENEYRYVARRFQQGGAELLFGRLVHAAAGAGGGDGQRRQRR